ncbi:MAG: alanyl-tRNA editing protein [Polyangiaceae bacterium]
MTQSTERLYFQDSRLLSFDARVLEVRPAEHGAVVILDRSAFYPESGGQLGDHGLLAGCNVNDVQIEDGVVQHILAPSSVLPEVGSLVRGEIAWRRRRVHMALHTGQHMLSRALTDEADAATVSSRLGETSCTIDVDRDVVDEAKVAKAEALVNSVIDDDIAIKAFFPTPEELSALPLRRAPKVTTDIRVVQIGDFDVSPCGGTHCTSTSQVELVRVVSIERYKGKARISFSAGPRARDELFSEAQLLRGLGKSFTCGPADVPGAIEKLRRELSDARERLGVARSKVADFVFEQIARRLEASEQPYAIAEIDGGVDLLRALAGRLSALQRGDVVSILAGRVDDGLSVLISRGPASKFDCGAFLKRLASAHGGRGGGRAEHAEGKFPATVSWESAVLSALDAG